LLRWFLFPIPANQSGPRSRRIDLKPGAALGPPLSRLGRRMLRSQVRVALSVTSQFLLELAAGRRKEDDYSG
jgi:hypothetical protein